MKKKKIPGWVFIFWVFLFFGSVIMWVLIYKEIIDEYFKGS